MKMRSQLLVGFVVFFLSFVFVVIVWLSSAGGLYFVGLTFSRVKDYKKALSYFEKVVKENPEFAKAYFYIGCCNGELGRCAEAIEAYKEAIRINLGEADVHYNL